MDLKKKKVVRGLQIINIGVMLPSKEGETYLLEVRCSFGKKKQNMDFEKGFKTPQKLVEWCNEFNSIWDLIEFAAKRKLDDSLFSSVNLRKPKPGARLSSERTDESLTMSEVKERKYGFFNKEGVASNV